MKITHNKVGQNLNLSDTSSTKKSERGAEALGGQIANLNNPETKSTNVNLSERAQDMKKAKDIASNAPDIREDRVAALQKMIDEGKYSVSSKDIADKMVDEELLWS